MIAALDNASMVSLSRRDSSSSLASLRTLISFCAASQLDPVDDDSSACSASCGGIAIICSVDGNNSLESRLRDFPQSLSRGFVVLCTTAPLPVDVVSFAKLYKEKISIHLNLFIR